MEPPLGHIISNSKIKFVDERSNLYAGLARYQVMEAVCQKMLLTRGQDTSTLYCKVRLENKGGSVVVCRRNEYRGQESDSNPIVGSNSNGRRRRRPRPAAALSRRPRRVAPADDLDPTPTTAPSSRLLRRRLPSLRRSAREAPCCARSSFSDPPSLLARWCSSLRNSAAPGA